MLKLNYQFGWNLNQMSMNLKELHSYHFAHWASFTCSFFSTGSAKFNIHKTHLTSDGLGKYRECSGIRTLQWVRRGGKTPLKSLLKDYREDTSRTRDKIIKARDYLMTDYDKMINAFLSTPFSIQSTRQVSHGSKYSERKILALF